jgi:DNA-binding beta-propeller fold protein YncE
MTRKPLLAPALVLVATTVTSRALAPAAPAPAATPAAPASSLPLSFVADLPLPGNPSRFDYQWIDATQRRLFIAHLGDSSLVVFDLDDQRVVREVPHLPSIHGVVAAPTEHLVLATATAEKTLALIDDTTLEVKSRVPAGEYPNGLAFDPASDRAFVSNNKGRGVAVIDVKTARALPGIDIGGGAGNTQWDAESGHVLAAVHGSPTLVDIDPARAQVAGRIALRGVTTCHGLLVASPLRLAFAACGGAAPLLVVVDLRARRQAMTLPLPGGIDVLAFDPGLHRLYAASETGMVAVFDVAADRSVAELGRGLLGPNAHTVAVDPSTHRVYFPLENVGGRPVLRVMDARVATGSPSKPKR